MAIVDSPEWLLSHIRHSFITSDDTGMCEMVIQENDLLTLDEHRKKLKEKVNKSKTLSASKNDIPIVPLAPSPDIQSGWDFGVRRRSNTAQKLERIRKERQSRVQIKTVHWSQLPPQLVGESKQSMFPKKATSDEKSHTRTKSVLSQKLHETVKIADNPFKDYHKFDGRGHEGTTSTQKINMYVYVYGEPPPIEPIKVVILLSGAKVIDLIGLSCWQYFTEKYSPPLKRSDVQGFTLNIAEDDGEVDYGFPALENNEPVVKFSFPTLALIEKHAMISSGEDDGKYCESVFVRVNDYAGFSLIQVDDLNVTMGEILKKALKRRKGHKYLGKYNLEYQEKVGVCVDTDQTLDSTGAMEFCMVREHSSRSAN
uniref:Target of rapamycin complex 2 subunit MAPKAP1 n=1 Tax=Ciona savignyi TaxID=51511 RepID=H2YZ13_CIOSA